MWAMPRRKAKVRHRWSLEGCKPQHQELSSGQPCLIAPSGWGRALCVASPALPRSVLPLGRTVTQSTPPETLTILRMAAKALHPARPCIPTAPPHLGPLSTDTADPGSGLSEPRLPRPPPAPQVELFESQGAPCSPLYPHSQRRVWH